MQSSHPEGRRWRSLSDVLDEHARAEDDHPLMPSFVCGVARDAARRVSFGDRIRPHGGVR